MTLPIFPNAKPLEIDDIIYFNPLRQLSADCSDFSFSNIFSWNTNNSCLISSFNSNIITIFPEYNNPNNSTVSVIGVNQLSSTFERVLDTQDIEVISLAPYLNREHYVEISTKFNVSEDRDSFDYLYDVDKTVKLEGPQYRHFRRGVSNANTKNTATFRFIFDQPLIPKMKDEILSISEEWARNRGLPSNYEEGTAIMNALNFSTMLPIRYSYLLADEVMCGFIIHEYIPERNQMIVHFEKTSEKYISISYLLKYNFFLSLQKKNIAVMNYEQDLGIDGLRSTKLNLCPSKFNIKYTISKK